MKLRFDEEANPPLGLVSYISNEQQSKPDLKAAPDFEIII